MSTFYIYLWTIIDGLREIISVIGVCCGIAIFVTCFASFLETTNPFELCKDLRKTACIIGMSCLVLHALIPNSKNLALIYVLPRIAESQAIQKDLPELYNLALSNLKNKLTNSIDNVIKP